MDIKIKIAIIALSVIVMVAGSSAAFLIETHVPDNASFYLEWLEQNMDAAYKILDSTIPIESIDVDEKLVF